jgi:lipopolysaccharide/colanic/teichoic acid biosynthesis glycosyltransferase
VASSSSSLRYFKVEDPKRYNDEVIFPDKVRINRYYLHHPSFLMDIRMILATLTGSHLEYGGETI